MLQVYGFSSAKKMASCLVDLGNGTLRLYNKGASEWILDASVAVYEADGTIVPLTDARKAALLDTVTEMASRGLRTLVRRVYPWLWCLSVCLARKPPCPGGAASRARGRGRAQVLTYADFPAYDPSRPADFFEEPPDRNLTVCCIVGIKDPVRTEVPGAVRTCTRAGIVVRMVTGDNIHTAQHIARECGILDDDGFAIEGPDFRAVPREEMMKRLPKLQARSPAATMTLLLSADWPRSATVCRSKWQALVFCMPPTR